MKKRAAYFLYLLFFGIIQITSADYGEVEVDDYYVKVYAAPVTTSNFIGLAQKGELYKLLGETSVWYRIQFKTTTGWLEKSKAHHFNPQSENLTSKDSTQQDSQLIQSPRTTTVDTSATDEFGDSTPIGKEIQTSTPPQSQTFHDNSFVNKLKESVHFTKKKELPKLTEHERNWFTQQVLHNVPSTESADEEPIKYFKVTLPTRILPYLDPNAPMMGTVRSGDRFLIVGEGEAWCRVVYKDTIGWIEKKCGKIESSADQPLQLDWVKISTFAAVLLAILTLIIITIIIIVRRRKFTIESNEFIKMKVLIISRSNKVIEYSLTDSTTTLDRCFSEIGFQTTFVKDSAQARLAIEKEVPDIILIDWQFERNIVANIERLFVRHPAAEKVLVIVFNVADPLKMQPSSILPNMSCLGVAFSDRDIFKLVTPLMSSSAHTEIQKSVQSSALEGDIGQGNLIEVLQFIEIGTKTGCLLVETGRPFAIIYFYQGRIIYAHAQQLTGRDAIFAVLNLKEGNFKFILDKMSKSSNVNLSTLEVLMEWTKALDEAHGH